MNAMLPEPDQLVTASDLVRHFGIWQENATRRPVYILNRGRPRFVLTSVEMMEALCQPAVAGPNATEQWLLDTVLDRVVLLDRNLAIVAMSRSARALFGEAASLGDLLPPLEAAYLADLAVQVGATAIPDRAEIASPRDPGRRLRVDLLPHEGGAALVVRDTTLLDTIARRDAEARAIDALLLGFGGGHARLDAQGSILGASPTLAELAGVDPATLPGIRFSRLFTNASRMAVNDGLDAALAGELLPPAEVTLVARSGNPIAAKVAFAPLRYGALVDGVIAMTVRAEHPAG
jgi:PAS domain-containing protein